MQDLREQVRAAFDRDQLAHPAPSALQGRIARAAVAPPRRDTRLQWMAVAAAIVIGLMVVSGLTWTRLGLRSAVSHPQAMPTPTTVPKVSGPPPAGVPVFYVRDAADPTIYFAIDWRGTPRGLIHFAQPMDDIRHLSQSPDGSAFVLPPSKGLGGQFFDRLGSPVGEAVDARFIWADDSKHLCALNFTGGTSGTWEIDLLAPNGTLTSSRPVALDSSIVQSGIIAIDFRACSPSNDRAVLVYNYFGRPTDVYVVRISDGKVLLHQTHEAKVLVDVAASPDGSLIAEDSSASGGYAAGPTAPSTVIRRTADGSVDRSLDPTYGVLAFSGDDSVALVNTSPWASGVATHLALVRLADGAVLWRYTGDEEFAAALVQPDGSSIAVMVQATTDQSRHPAVGVTIVHADGTTTRVPGRNMRP